MPHSPHGTVREGAASSPAGGALSAGLNVLDQITGRADVMPHWSSERTTEVQQLDDTMHIATCPSQKNMLAPIILPGCIAFVNVAVWLRGIY